MRVRLECDRMDAGVFQNMGDVVDLDPVVARRMIESGSASVVREQIETATNGPAENAAKRTPPKRGR